MNIAAVRKNWEGQLIGGRFPLLQCLGGSENSAAFLTEMRGQEPRKAVLKLIPANAGNAEARISRWKVTAGLSHPHLIRLFHMGQCEVNATPLLYVVMEYAEEDLSQIVPLRPLTPAEAGEMLPPVVDALSYVHEKGLVHGHIKPSNIMVVDNQLKLSSDGIHAPGELGPSALEQSVYDAPEAATGAILPAADVWSLGITLVTALTQHPPTCEKSGQGEPTLPQSIPRPFQDIARESLRRDPGDRCTLGQIRARLQPSSIPSQAVERPVQTVEVPAAKPRRIGRLMAPIIAGLIVVAVLAGMKLASHRTQVRPAAATGKVEQPAASHASRPSPARSPEAATNTPKGAVVPGAVADRVLPDVSQKARDTIQGTVRVSVRVSVNAAGEVLVATLDSPGPSRYFANLALKAARGWKFHPPQVDGQSAASEWILRFQFRRTETQVVPSFGRVAVNPPPAT
jgi:TonB family protein